MNKMTLVVFASATLFAASAAIGADKTYVTGSNGKAVMIGSSCVVAGGNGTALEGCGGGATMAKKAEATMEKMEKPAAMEKMAKPAMAKAAPGTKYVADGSGKNPVMIGSNCVVAGGNGSHFDQCGGGAMMDDDKKMAGDKMKDTMAAPKPKIITKVIVDCSKCK